MWPGRTASGGGSCQLPCTGGCAAACQLPSLSVPHRLLLLPPLLLQVVSDYLTPYDGEQLYLRTMNKPVALYTYRMAFRRAAAQQGAAGASGGASAS
jgi:hypothetical protein